MIEMQKRITERKNAFWQEPVEMEHNSELYLKTSIKNAKTHHKNSLI